jgi:Lon protease-like protein
MSMGGHTGSLSAVPLFPLPNVVLFPRAVLPLHIFEDRYKAMTADVLAGNRLVAMALLKAGWEKDYYQFPAIEPVVCVGEILSWEQLPDGKYNFLLQGRTRARVISESKRKAYRVAELNELEEAPILEIDLEHERSRMIDLFSAAPFGALPIARQFRELLNGPIPTDAIADLAAFNLLEDIPMKQQLLEDIDIRHRIGRIVEELRLAATHVNPGLMGFPADPGSN